MKNLPCRRVLWIVMVIAAALALTFASSHVDAQGILRDSPLLPVGGVLAVIAVIVTLLDVLLTLRNRRRA